MKKLSIIAAILLVAFSAEAQFKNWKPSIKKPVPDERIQTFVNPKASKGFYLSTSMGSQLNEDQPFVKIGAAAALMFNDKIAIGVAGYGYTNDLELNPENGLYTYAEGSYTGLLIEPMFFSNQRVHFTVPTIIGGGSTVTYEVDRFSSYTPGERFVEADYFNRHNYLLVEPGLNMELNITRFLRMGVTASYTITSDLNKNRIQAPTLDGLNASMNLKLGWF